MISLPIGIFAIIAVIGYALTGISADILLNMHTLVLVCGGTLAVFALSTPYVDIFGLFNALADLRKPDVPLRSVADDLVVLSKNKQSGTKNSHPLTTYAQDLWKQGVDTDMFHGLLMQRLEELNRGTEQAVASLRNLSKYPPALGMVGTVLGIVVVFSQLTPESRASIGPNLAYAMTATFYGLLLANAVLMPMADRLYVMHLRRSKLNNHVFHILRLIEDGEPTALIEGELNEKAA